MAIKQGEENTDFIKEEDERTRNYILQKNKKTKVAVAIIVVALILILIALVLSGYFFEGPA